MIRQALFEVVFSKVALQIVSPILFIVQITLSFVLLADVPTVNMAVIACIVSPMLNF